MYLYNSPQTILSSLTAETHSHSLKHLTSFYHLFLHQPSKNHASFSLPCSSRPITPTTSTLKVFLSNYNFNPSFSLENQGQACVFAFTSKNSIEELEIKLPPSLTLTIHHRGTVHCRGTVHHQKSAAVVAFQLGRATFKSSSFISIVLPPMHKGFRTRSYIMPTNKGEFPNLLCSTTFEKNVFYCFLFFPAEMANGIHLHSLPSKIDIRLLLINSYLVY